MGYTWLLLLVFFASLAGVFWVRGNRAKKDEVGAQFVITGTLLILFYLVCFMSGICTILNFIWRWVL